MSAKLEATRKFVKALERTQYYPPGRMQAYQRQLLEPLLHHAKREVPFYATRLDPLFASDGSIRWDAWADVPTFTRADAQKAGQALFAKSYPHHMGSYVENQTSGSTGMPLKFRMTAAAHLMGTAASQRIFDWHAVNCAAKMALIVDVHGKFPFPDGAKGRQWNVKTPHAPACQLTVKETIENQLQWVLATGSEILTTYPSIAVAMGQLAEQRGLALPFHTFIGQGEVFSENAKAYLARTHKLKLIDRYGASELGAIAAQCPEETGYHQFCEAGLMEVLDFKDHLPITNGRGQLVLTPFYNYAMPLIRYENQDQVEVTSKPCACGRTLPIIQKILGREKNVFTYIDGSRSWPTGPASIYPTFLPSQQIQVIQKTMTQLEVRFVRDDSSSVPVNVQGLEGVFRKHLHPSIHIELIEMEKIPRSASGKYEQWISLISGYEE